MSTLAANLLSKYTLSMASEADQAQAWTALAHILRPQGRKGEVLADLLFDDPDRFTDHSSVFLGKPGFDGPASAARDTEIVDFWLPTGKNRGRIVLHFAGIDSISAAEPLAGLDILIPTADRLPLEVGEEYVADLVGCTVFDENREVGKITSLEFSTALDGKRMSDVAPLLIVVTRGGDEVLIPYVNDFLISLDTKTRRMEMKLPPGLTDLNLTNASKPPLPQHEDDPH